MVRIGVTAGTCGRGGHAGAVSAIIRGMLSMPAVPGSEPGWWDNAADQVRTAHPDIAGVVLRQGFVLGRWQLRECGIDDAEWRRRVRAGDWRPLRRGVVAVVDPPAYDGPVLDAAAVLDGAAAVLDGAAVLDAAAAVLVRPHHLVSHRSAALMHGLPTFGRPARPELSRSGAAYSRAAADLVVRTARVPDADRASWFGVPLTTPARTAVDLARVSRRAGIMATDAALRLGLASVGDLAGVFERGGGAPGIVRAREIVELADPRAESPLESLTRLMIVDGRLPAPDLQVQIAGYRADFLFRAQRLIVEADGRVKYVDDALWREKLRQEALERAGFRVLRVVWDDVVNHPAQTVARIERGLRLL